MGAAVCGLGWAQLHLSHARQTASALQLQVAAWGESMALIGSNNGVTGEWGRNICL